MMDTEKFMIALKNCLSKQQELSTEETAKGFCIRFTVQKDNDSIKKFLQNIVVQAGYISVFVTVNADKSVVFKSMSGKEVGSVFVA
jgi:hypothetical protein